MMQQVKRSGNYVLFDTTQQYHMIALDDRDFFVWRGPDRLELSDQGHEAAEILHQGAYFLFDATRETQIDAERNRLSEAPGNAIITYLACREGAKYRLYALPEGLPTHGNRIVDVGEAPAMLTRSELAI